ncbi:MAG: hypothetical protein H7329_11880 [Opitutaceae bacterium]|nr:hypothetical protein [Cytophagales bacterium]
MRILFLFIFNSFISIKLIAQEDSLLTSLLEEQPKEKTLSPSAFKGTRLINGHTVEMLGKKTLEFRVAHRFGDVEGGTETFWGLDKANMNLTFDYSFSNRLTIGVGRNSYQKLYEGTVKYKVLRQTTDNSMPLSVVILGKANALTNTKGSQYEDPINTLSYFGEIIIGRRFNNSFSFQLSPSFIHFNLASETFKSNDIVSITASGSYKFTKSAAVTSEYTQTLNDYYYKDIAAYIPTFSLGFDLETGGHVFQLFFTNAFAMNETQYIPFTSTDWGRNQFRFGFNISRTFGFGKKNKK